MNMTIPFVDLKAQYASIQADIDAAIHNVIQHTAFIEGKFLEAFEQHFAQFLGVKHCIGVANGTDAILLALKALGIQAGDEVITAANSYIATAEAISHAGATPVFVDCDPTTYNLNVEKLEQAITNKSRAVIPVHLYGQSAEIDRIIEIASKHQLVVIEDAAQAHGARYKGQMIGTFGDCACFSFYPGKNLGAYGDGGAIVTNCDDLAEFMRMYRNHGGIKKYEHRIVGMNSRLDGLQAAILDAKLPYLEQWNERRRTVAAMYNAALQEYVVTPTVLPEASSVYHLYVIRAPRRDTLRERLSQKGVATGIHYPTPIPYLPAYRFLNYSPQDCPVAYSYKDELLSLPIYGDMTDEQVEYVTEQVKQCL